VKQKLTRNERRLAKKEAKAAKQKANGKAKKSVVIKRTPRAQRLPGMEDAAIRELETLAEDMADVISQKKELMASEKTLNENLVAAMKKHGKTVYSHHGITINLSATEKAKVVIKEVDDTPADPESAPAPHVNAESLAVHAEG
jgi:hypothetical protein